MNSKPLFINKLLNIIDKLMLGEKMKLNLEGIKRESGDIKMSPGSHRWEVNYQKGHTQRMQFTI